MENEQNIIHTLNKFYEIISGNKGEPRDWVNLCDLFITGAVLTPYVFSSRSDEKNISYDINGYIDRLKNSFAQHDLHEKGFNYKVTVYGNIANVYSEYSAEIVKNNETYMKKGINLIQLMNQGNGWKIVSMLWENTSGSD